jgi:starch phosphorylase
VTPIAADAIPETTGLSAAFAAAYARELGQSSQGATPEACLRAAALACRELLEARWARTQERDRRLLAQDGRRVHYLSMEFLMGRALGNAIAALGLEPDLRRVLAAAGHDLGEGAGARARCRARQRRPGSAGRPASWIPSPNWACPPSATACAIATACSRKQIQDGRQVESPDDWMRGGTPWDLERPDLRFSVGFGGRVVSEGGRRRWLPAQRVLAVAHDFVVPARDGEQVSTLRQWQATAEQPIDLAAFTRGELEAAARPGVAAESLNWVLYPDDSTGLRARAAAEAGSAARKRLAAGPARAPPARARQPGAAGPAQRHPLNDTHPALAPAN